MKDAFFLLLSLCVFCLPAQARFCGGRGEPGDPYLICGPNHIQVIGDHPEEWGKQYELTADIDLSGYTGTQFNIIGNEAIPFSGVFDGKGHTISNFTYTCTGTDNVAIFGYVSGNDAEIKNLSLVNPYVDAGTGRRVGCLAGYLCDGTIADCHIEGGGVQGGDGSFSEIGRLVGFNTGGNLINCSVEEGYVWGGGECVGGLVGYNEGEITNCCATTTDIWATADRVGGLVGYSEGEVTNCHAATTNMWATADRVGGLIGENGWSDTIIGIVSNCSAGGEVAGDQLVGGLVGYNEGEIYNSYAMGSVSGDSYIGGLVGINQDDSVIRGLISECYSTGPVSGNNRVGGLVGNNSGRIYYSYAMGSVLGTGDGPENLGGLVGRSVVENAIISNCYAMGDVTEGGSRVGGLVGLNSGASILRCYSTGGVSGDSQIGGLVGKNLGGGIVDYSFWDVNSSGLDTSDGGTGKTTAEMMTESTFTEDRWDFNTPIWTICSCGGNYPRFWWEEPRTYHINAVGGNDENTGLTAETAFATIQMGIDTALGCEKVLVWPGVYTGWLDFLGKAITVASAAGAAVLEAPDYYPVWFHHAEDANSVFKNFIVRNSYGGVYVYGASPTIRNVTVVDCNIGVVGEEGANPDIRNCIFWNNTYGGLFQCEARYSCLENGGEGIGNISEDPLFVDPANGDYHLKSAGWRWSEDIGEGPGWTWDAVTSRCIDAGNPGSALGDEVITVLPDDPNNDRGINLRVNMGAYGGTDQASMPPCGWAFLADLNNDGIVNYVDWAWQVQDWLETASEQLGDLNRDGLVNMLDLAFLAEEWVQETEWAQ